MKFTVFASLLTAASALKSNSSAGQNLLSKSRALEENQASWVVDYSIQFASCHTVEQYNFGGDGDNGGDGDENNANGVTLTNLVKFKLCPTNKCGYGCKGAEYLTDMNEFVNAYTEWQMNDIEYKCEQIRESCACDGDDVDDEDTCESNCYSTAGMTDQCVENENDNDDYQFDLQDFMECKEIDNNGDDGSVYYVGPTCSSNGQRINLGVFTDQYCTQSYDDSVFAKATGISLPYASESIVSEYCISCKQEDANNDGYYYDPEITEICEQSYEQSAKCESKLSSSLAYPITSGCTYINNLAMHEVGYNPTSKSAAVGFAVFFGISTAVLAAFAFKLHSQSKKTINLNSNDGAVV